MTSKGLQLGPSFTLTKLLGREQIVPIVVLFAVSSFLTITLEDALKAMAQADDGSRWMVQLAMGLWDLVEGILLILVLSWGIAKVRSLNEAHMQKHPFETPYLGSFLAEYFRVLANVLLWGLLFILPGFYRYCRLILVPFVALFARSYREGQADALELAGRLARGRMGLFIAVMIVTSALQFGLEFLPQLKPEFHLMSLRLVFNGLSYAISVWMFAFLFLHFERALEEAHDGESPAETGA
jgi:hypothetical protein